MSRAFLFRLLAACAGLAACGDDISPADSSVLIDAGAEDGAAEDDMGGDAVADTAAADVAADLGVDARPADVGFVDMCEGDCAMTDLRASFGAATASFTLAYFGNNSDGTLRVEVYGGVTPGCPSMDSPTPDRTLILANVPALSDRIPAMVVASMLDFEGTLVSMPLVRATSATVQGVAAQLEGDSRFVRFDFIGMFDAGTITGSVYATHCDSLDE